MIFRGLTAPGTSCAAKFAAAIIALAVPGGAGVAPALADPPAAPVAMTPLPSVPDNEGVTPRVQAQVARGLDYLVKQQQADDSFDSPDAGGPRLEVTANVLLAYLSCGDAPDHGRYGVAIHDAIAFLAQQAPPDGYLGGVDSSGMRGQATMALALARAYGLESSSQRQETRAALQNAVAFILANRDRRTLSAWGAGPSADQANLYVTALTLQALRAAREEGFAVGDDVGRRAAEHALKTARFDSAGRLIGFAEAGQSPSAVSTAAAMVCLRFGAATERNMANQAAALLARTPGDPIASAPAAAAGFIAFAAQMARAPLTPRQWAVADGAQKADAARSEGRGPTAPEAPAPQAGPSQRDIDARDSALLAIWKAQRDRLLPRQGPDGAWPAPQNPAPPDAPPAAFNPPGRVCATALAIRALALPFRYVD
jgi:hypothetical protein